MDEDKQQEPGTEQIAQLVKDFLALKAKFHAFLPEELSRLQSRLENMAPQGETYRRANHELFYRITSALCMRSNLTMGELSSAVSVPLSTATRMVDWLVDNGYAARLGDPEDRRIVRVALTESGRQTYQLAKAYIAQRVQQIFSALTTEERQTLFSLLGKVARALRNMDA